MESVIAGREEHFTILGDGRCQCQLNGHVFSSNPEDVLKFINGSKYQRLLARFENEKQMAQYAPFIYTSKNFPDKMYCALTAHVMNKNLISIERHIQGKKYKKAKEQYDKGEFELIEEPDLEDEEDDEEEEEIDTGLDAAMDDSSLETLDQEDDVEEHAVRVTRGNPHVKEEEVPSLRHKQKAEKHQKKRHKAAIES
ncbi:probable surfeit locus protein 2 at N-terminal half [Coccomyxa sp. Obi]|nr:probable surfeit locus protein 2 at N-terminal half [Coccomyxa sp. Obi]